MKQLRPSKFIKADALTLVLAAIWVVAAVWLIVNTWIGATNILTDRVFSFAFGLNVGNFLRLYPIRRPHGGELPTN